jgi:hypothetical protein
MPGPRAPTPASRESHRFRATSRSRPLTRVGWAVAALVVGVAWPAPCRAAGDVRVLLLRAVPTGETLAETILRIKSELGAAGFDVAVEDVRAPQAASDMRALMERAGGDSAPAATLGIFGDLEHGPAELWVVDRITGKTVVRRTEVVAADDRRISEVLAIRAEELLRASLVELLLERDRASARPAAPAAPKVEGWVKQGVRPGFAPWRLAIEAGAATLGGWGGLGASVAPTARVRMALGERFWLRASGLGFGTQPLVSSGDAASARVSQTILLLECGASPWPRRLVRPLVSLGAGAERIGIEGNALAPYQGESNARWFAAGDVGLGMAVRLHAHWELLVETHALFTTPRPAVQFFDLQAARAGQPTLLAVVTLAGGA